MSLKGQKCRGYLTGWRQYGILMGMRIEQKGDKFSREFRLQVNLYSVIRSLNNYLRNNAQSLT